jgi:NAD-dependent deacetylase
MPADAAILRLAERLKKARRVTVVTGAGVSAASGIPTFRGAGGLWRNYRVEELATLAAFDRDPRLVWEWYAWRRGLVADARPNRAHEVLAAWSRRFTTFRLITQNVDGLHERAGTGDVVRFHGSLWEVSCRDACGRVPARWREDRPFEELPPRCAGCGGLLRPAVTWFGEPIDPEILEAAKDALDCDVCIAIGTSAVVYPAAGLVTGAGALGAFTAEINPEATPASRAVDAAIAGPAESVLDELDRLLGPH